MNNQKQTSGLGIAALILSILGCTFIIGAILAIIDLASNNGKSKTLSKIALGICGAWLVIGIIGMFVNKGNKNSTTTTSVTTEATTEVATSSDNESTTEADTQASTDSSTASFTGDTVVTADFTIDILEYKVIQPGEAGNQYGEKPVLAIWYNTTNTSGKDIDPTTAWTYTMTAIQDNNPDMVNELNVGLHPDESLLDSQMASIKEGGTVKNAVAYELTDLETPVELKATNGLFGEDLGSKIIDIK